VPNGFTISLFAKDLGDPRVLAWDAKGTLVVSLTAQGKVIALPDSAHDGVADRVVTVLSGLDLPHGLAFRGNTLYVAESDGVSTYAYNPDTFTASGRKKIIDLPDKGFHFTRTIAIGPDDKLYVATGSDCNVCVEKDPHRAAIYMSNPDGSDFHLFASGLRNAVFFTWGPYDTRMWATVMGRDSLGDDIPPDTIDIVTAGKNFGWPYCYGKKVWDATFDGSQKAKDFCTTTEPSHIDIQAHSAPLGLAFVPKSWPAEYRNSLLVAMHGSWNRSIPTGYKIARFQLDSTGNYVGVSDFISGWLTSKGALGRPVDLLFDNNGALYISDDKAGEIYRLIVSTQQIH
jgi:glucose/arabinose dehydrogenase